VVKLPIYSDRAHRDESNGLITGKNNTTRVVRFFHPTLQLLHPFHRYSRSNCTVVRKRALFTRSSKWVNIRQLNFVVSGPKFTSFFSFSVGWVVVESCTFLPSQMFRVRPFQKCVPVPKFLSLPRGTSRGQVWRGYSHGNSKFPTGPKVI